jgi:hypothetical protein
MATATIRQPLGSSNAGLTLTAYAKGGVSTLTVSVTEPDGDGEYVATFTVANSTAYRWWMEDVGGSIWAEGDFAVDASGTVTTLATLQSTATTTAASAATAATQAGQANTKLTDGSALTTPKDASITSNKFAAGATVPRVTLVDTTTTNTDMRGTDSALLALNYTAPLNAAGTRAALGMASANFDTQVGGLLTSTAFTTYAPATGTALAAVGVEASQANTKLTNIVDGTAPVVATNAAGEEYAIPSDVEVTVDGGTTRNIVIRPIETRAS